jgi:hypothetical protein
MWRRLNGILLRKNLQANLQWKHAGQQHINTELTQCVDMSKETELRVQIKTLEDEHDAMMSAMDHQHQQSAEGNNSVISMHKKVDDLRVQQDKLWQEIFKMRRTKSHTE